MKALEEAKRLIAEIERRNLALEPDRARALLQESGPRVLRALVAEVEGREEISPAFEHAEALAALLRSTAHVKFKRGGMIVARDALEFFGTSHSHTREQRIAARERVRDVLRLAEEWITTHGPIVFGDLRVTLSDVVGLAGLQIMLAKKFARELEAP